MRWFLLTVALTACTKTQAPPPPGPEAAAPTASAVAAVVSAPSAPAALAPPLDTSCASDDECVPAPSCCSVPCTSNVINKKDLPRARAALGCDPAVKCFSAGSCRTHAYLCIARHCALVHEGEPGYHAR